MISRDKKYLKVINLNKNDSFIKQCSNMRLFLMKFKKLASLCFRFVHYVYGYTAKTLLSLQFICRGETLYAVSHWALFRPSSSMCCSQSSVVSNQDARLELVFIASRNNYIVDLYISQHRRKVENKDLISQLNSRRLRLGATIGLHSSVRSS